MGHNRDSIMNLELIIMILLVHWIADFVAQTDKEATNKSSDFAALLSHTATYSVIWFAALLIIGVIAMGGDAISEYYAAFVMKFTFITFITHTVIDYYTSKANAILWKKDKRHEFFVSIGFDQLLHYIQLFATFMLL